ncbi:MAG: methylthioribulose 1-phosphate dehydratase [Thioalkalispiraceae bacterium]|jgi:methylthioribulose-1-phosphate dehydratase
MSDFRQSVEQIIAAGTELYRLGMVPATSGNFSMRMDDGNIAITVSGTHKGKLSEQDIMQINPAGESLDGKTPSAETLLHTQIYQNLPDVNAVLHPHMMSAILVAQRSREHIKLEDYELLKALEGIRTHNVKILVPVFNNDQDIARLAKKIQISFDNLDPIYAYIIAGHGLYTWGRTMDAALRHVEALDYLFQCQVQS